jgi:TM2 domain-containing membrane protein YozV
MDLNMAMPEPEDSDTKPCPMCGESIKRVAVRCKHCQADLSTTGLAKLPDADFNRGASPPTARPAATAMDDFEVRFLEFAYQTTSTMNVTAVAHALKLPTGLVNDRLEEMAARDVIGRDVDDEGNVFFTIHGRKTPRAPAHPPLQGFQQPGPLAPISGPADATAVTAMVLNVVLPGLGSIISGRTSLGVGQLVLWAIGIPLCFIAIGFPMVLGAWVWSVVTGVRILEESKRRQIQS